MSVKVLIVTSILWYVWLVQVGLLFFDLSVEFGHQGMGFSYTQDAIVVGAFYIILGLVGFALSICLRTGKEWVWDVYVRYLIMDSISVFFIPIIMTRFLTYMMGEIPTLWAIDWYLAGVKLIIYNIPVFYYLFKPHIKYFFGQGPPPPMPTIVGPPSSILLKRQRWGILLLVISNMVRWIVITKYAFYLYGCWGYLLVGIGRGSFFYFISIIQLIVGLNTLSQNWKMLIVIDMVTLLVSIILLYALALKKNRLLRYLPITLLLLLTGNITLTLATDPSFFLASWFAYSYGGLSIRIGDFLMIVSAIILFRVSKKIALTNSL